MGYNNTNYSYKIFYFNRGSMRIVWFGHQKKLLNQAFRFQPCTVTSINYLLRLLWINVICCISQGTCSHFTAAFRKLLITTIVLVIALATAFNDSFLKLQRNSNLTVHLNFTYHACLTECRFTLNVYVTGEKHTVVKTFTNYNTKIFYLLTL